jgi:hypothetical protein
LSIHPLVDQLRFTRSEFLRAVRGVGAEEARRRFLPMNCLSWNVGHLAWQEQRYFLWFPRGELLYPEIARDFAYGAAASTPPLRPLLEAWTRITETVDPWLDSLSANDLTAPVERKLDRTYGNLLQRVIYHYWYHTGENMAIRQQLGNKRLPEFVGNLDQQAPFRLAE